jgi:DHA2 family multidrug resistance protein
MVNKEDTAALPAAMPHRGLVSFSVMVASFMQALDTTIANVALPHVQGSLSATQDQMTWVLTSYIIAAAIMTPLSGWLAGQFGRKRVFLYSIVGFTVASAFCGLAQSLPQIVLARLFQGLSGAALIPLSQAVLLDIHPPAQHARAMAIWVMGITVGPIFGPVLGGWLTENYEWRWVFYINVPFGILAFAGVASFMTETRTLRSRFDFFGFAKLSVAIGAFQLMLDRGQLRDWFSSSDVFLTAAVAAVAFYLFVVHMLTANETRFVSPALFEDRNFLTGSVFIFVVGAVVFATLALLPPLLQGLLNYPVSFAGIVISPRGVGSMAALLIMGRLLGKIDGRLTIAAGLGLTAFSLWQMTGFYLQMDSSVVIWSGLMQGVGMGFFFVPLTSITFATLSPHLRNEGAAVFSLARNIGSSVGISVVQTLLTRNTQIMHSRLAELINPYRGTLDFHPRAMLESTRGLAILNERVTAQAAMIAYNNNFKVTPVEANSLRAVALLSATLWNAPRNPCTCSAFPFGR